MPTDKAVMLYRRGIKKLIKNLQEGIEPPQPQKIKGDTVRTNGQDTIIRAPKRNKNDKQFVKEICKSVLNIQFEHEDNSLIDRDKNIISKIKEMEERANFDF